MVALEKVPEYCFAIQKSKKAACAGMKTTGTDG